jgi:hypothetical protein
MSPLQVHPVAPADWPALAAGFEDLGFEQCLPYAQAAATRIGAEAWFLRVERAGVPVAAAGTRIRRIPGLGRGIAWVPSGPLILPRGGPVPDAATLGAILTALRDRIAGQEGHVLRLRLSGLAQQEPEGVRRTALEAGFADTPRAPRYRSIAIDLTRSPEALMAALNGKWRTDLRFALKSGLTLQRGTGPAIEARFLAMLGAVQAAKGFRPEIGPAFHFPLHGRDYAVETLIAVKDGQDVAGIVTGTAGGCATYLFGATADAGRPLRAGYFLTWEAIRLAQARRLAWYDLGGTDAATNPDVTRFKERMNGLPLFAEAFEARPPGLAPRLVLGAEALRARLKRR